MTEGAPALGGSTIASPADRRPARPSPWCCRSSADIEFGEHAPSVPAALQAGSRPETRGDEAVDSRWTVPSLPPQLTPPWAAHEMRATRPLRRRAGRQVGRPCPSCPRRPQHPEIDWFARQVGLAVEGNCRLFVSNRFQVVCHDIPSGPQAESLTCCGTALSRDPARQELPAPAYEYPLTPMRPVIAGPHLFVRRLMRAPRLAARPPTRGQLPNTVPAAVATLACLETATGKVRWSDQSRHRPAALRFRPAGDPGPGVRRRPEANRGRRVGADRADPQPFRRHAARRTAR